MNNPYESGLKDGRKQNETGVDDRQTDRQIDRRTDRRTMYAVLKKL